MPDIRMECTTEEVVGLLKVHWDEIQCMLREASAAVLGYPYSDIVVRLPPALAAASDNAEPLTIYTFASDRQPIHGKEIEWRNALGVAWHQAMNNPSLMEVARRLPNNKVAIWPHIAPGAKWGTVEMILADVGNTA